MELEAMNEARRRDVYCRFVDCDCGREITSWRAPEVSHKRHRGMGWNPALDRTTPEELLLLCPRRHKESLWSVDQGGVYWVPMSPEKGANGPIIWLLDTTKLPDGPETFWLRSQARPDGSVILAAEIAPHRYMPFFPAIIRALDWLKSQP